jgi:penicillin-binding protein 1A
MVKILFILVFAVSLFIGYDSYKEYLPPKVQKTIQRAADGRLLDDYAPDALKRAGRFFRAQEEVRQKMAAPGWVKLEDIPLVMQQAIIAVEDNRFYQHGAFDLTGLMRALLSNIQAGEIVEGGSTITQQLAKILFLSQEQTIGRKLEEAVYGVILESNFSKEEILETYLNSIYFGSGAYGIKEAARRYFNKEPAQLTVAECTLLAGVPAAPSVYSPLENLSAAKKRQGIVLEAMVKNGVLGPQRAKEILAEELPLAAAAR